MSRMRIAETAELLKRSVNLWAEVQKEEAFSNRIRLYEDHFKAVIQNLRELEGLFLKEEAVGLEGIRNAILQQSAPRPIENPPQHKQGGGGNILQGGTDKP